MASLTIFKGPNPGQRVALEGDKFILGRDPNCHVIVPGSSVSRTHAQILRLQSKFYIEDLKSRNKTYVNNEEVKPPERRLLKDSDQIRICDLVYTFQDSARPLPADMEDEDSGEQDTSSSFVEAAVSHLSSHTILETQPAEKLKAILDISTSLSRTFDVDSLLPKIVDSLFHLFKQADRGFLILRDLVNPQKLRPRVIKTRRQGEETDPRFSKGIVNQALESVQGILSDDAMKDPRFDQNKSILDMRIRSVMCAPLWTQDNKGFGVIQLDSTDRHKKFTQDDLKLLMGVASQASIALENAKFHQDLVARERLKRELELAREVQRSFLPNRSPEVAGYEFFACYESAQEVGGDYYDFIPLAQQRSAALLGDVAGKGVAAALLMAKVSADARFCMLTEPTPADAITQLNNQLLQTGLSERFVTLAAAVLDPMSHELTLVNAGHPSPLVYRRATGQMEEATPNDIAGLPLGVLDNYEYLSCNVQLQPGDTLVIFSDGVTEAMDVHENQFGMEGIYEAVKGGPFTPKGLGERIVKAVRQHSAGRSQHDDITLVSFGRTMS